MATTFHNLIGGRWIPAKSGRTFTNLNPATGAALGEFPDSGADDVDAAVQAARGAMRAWQLTPAPKRGEMLFKLGGLISQRKEELARSATRELG